MVDTATMRPRPSRTGDEVIATSMGVPSLCRRCVRRPVTLSPFALLELGRAPLEVPDLQRQQQRVFAFESRFLGDCRFGVELIVESARAHHFRELDRAVGLDLPATHTAAVPPHGLQNGLLLIRRQILEYLDLIGCRGLSLSAGERGETGKQA